MTPFQNAIVQNVITALILISIVAVSYFVFDLGKDEFTGAEATVQVGEKPSVPEQTANANVDVQVSQPQSGLISPANAEAISSGEVKYKIGKIDGTWEFFDNKSSGGDYIIIGEPTRNYVSR